MVHQYKTINTFSQPPSCPQVMAYIVIALQCSLFYVTLLPEYKSVMGVGVTISYSVSLVLMVLFALICSCSDPSDQCLMEQPEGIGPPAGLSFCSACSVYVGRSSRHCRQCDRCVEGFDHHCVWINNCVGSKNYLFFMLMTISSFLHLTAYVVGVVIVVTSVQDLSIVLIINLVTCCVIGVFWLMVLVLLIFHFFLMCKGYTTYEYMLKRRRRGREVVEKKREMEVKEQTEAEMKVKKQRGEGLGWRDNKVYPSFEEQYDSSHQEERNQQRGVEESLGRLRRQASLEYMKEEKIENDVSNIKKPEKKRYSTTMLTFAEELDQEQRKYSSMTEKKRKRKKRIITQSNV